MSAAPTAVAVLFDMDGLLVDSEPLWFDVELEIMTALGADWQPADQHACVGGPLRKTAIYMAARAGRPIEPTVIEGWLLDGMAARLARGVPLLPGARALLDDCAAAGLPCGLVSSSYRRLVDLVLAGIGPGTFAISVAGDEVRHRKPHPEPYLTAAVRLGLDPRRCVVLEDSVTGLLSGEAAGCPTVGVPDLVPLPPAPGRRVIASLTEIDAAWLRSVVDEDSSRDRQTGSVPAP